MVEKTKSRNAVDALAAGGKSLATSISSPLVTTLKAELSPIGTMSQALNESPELMMGMSAIGDAFSELGQNDEAFEYYIKAAELRTNDFTTPVYLMKAANAAYSLGEKNKALSLYKRIQNEFASSREGQNIGKYISRITAAE